MITPVYALAFNPAEESENWKKNVSIPIALFTIFAVAAWMVYYARSNRGSANRVNQSIVEDFKTWCEEPLEAKDRTLRRIAADRIINVRITGATRLDLSNLMIDSFPSNREIWKMPNLKRLDLKGNRLKKLPAAMGQLQLEFCDMSGNPDLPRSVRLSSQ